MSRVEKFTKQELLAVDAWWRANMYLSVGQIYLQENPLLRRPLSADDIKPRLLGHWGTSAGLGFIYAHLNRLIKKTGQSTIYIAGPGHGGPALVGASYLEGTYSDCFPKVTQDFSGMRRLFRQFSAPGGIPSHCSVTTPGSIHEGGELGYALSHAFGAAFDNPDLLVAAVVGDGEAETGPLEGSWKGISFLNPVHDGAVLPILHLNGAKIASPSVLSRKDPDEVTSLFEGHGYEVVWVEGDDLPWMHERFAAALAYCYDQIKDIQESARQGNWDGSRPIWPMIILRTPKGWTGPHQVDGKTVEGTWRAHQVPLSGVKQDPDHLKLLEEWMRSYKIEELFNEDGSPSELVESNNPEGDLRMSANPHANGGLLTKDLNLPDFKQYAVEVTPGSRASDRLESTRKLGEFLRDIYRDNPDNFRLFCPDETNSNRLGAVFDVSDRTFMERVNVIDEKLSPQGRVMEVLSEHNCHGWLDGYNLTGRHGMFASYEAFGMVSASMTMQAAKWLQEANALDWRAKVPSTNILLSSTCWRNDHNGFSHQAPELLQIVLNMRGEVGRIYLPPDANCLLAVSDHVFRTKNLVNLIVQDKQPQPQWLSMDEAIEHCNRGYGIWDWAGSDGLGDEDPDIVVACAGDVVTMEAVAAAEIVKTVCPQIKIRFVNVVNLTSLYRPKDHPSGMSTQHFKDLFTDDVDVIFAFHGYPGAIHQLVHGRPDADRFRARGFKEQGTTTTPFDMVVRNEIDRYHLVMDILNNAKRVPDNAIKLYRWCESQLARHQEYIVEHLEDMPEVRNWKLGSFEAPDLDANPNHSEAHVARPPLPDR
ncbi:phosphoketolase family protein [Propionimicrobium lymphophilum]|uniref:phosphoketolase family protein n=1 Tax=Propionimicrobium lymphophilum TaxID=33012 RepID=UPI0025513202|nr:phosphoketolase family protein [Propionimicrobium lymphophilum]MDK7709724.1 phosphoketolase family protein [Propionimicrobium lymphophilum]MDK7734014.1 phosphoketolase family protein [Propionimicrobium lymphophilum]